MNERRGRSGEEDSEDSEEDSEDSEYDLEDSDEDSEDSEDSEEGSEDDLEYSKDSEEERRSRRRRRRRPPGAHLNPSPIPGGTAETLLLHECRACARAASHKLDAQSKRTAAVSATTSLTTVTGPPGPCRWES